jgi:hypothetical protein
MWKCRTCRELADRLICDHCAKNCHARHLLESAGDVEGYCTCGVKCTIVAAVATAAGPPRFTRVRVPIDDDLFALE